MSEEKMPLNTISSKKLFAMLAVELFGMTSLILPAVLVGFAGKCGLPVLLSASALLPVQAAWYACCLKRKKKSPDQIVDEELKKGTAVWIKWIYSLRFFIHGLFLSILFLNLIEEVLLPGRNRFFLLLPALVLIGLAGRKQLRVRGRILEVLFPCIFLPLLIVLFLALFQLDYAALPAQLWGGLRQAVSGTLLGKQSSGDGQWSLYSVYGILLFYQPMEFLLFLHPGLAASDREKRWTVSAVCAFVILLNTMMYAAAVGLLGTVRTGEKLWSALYIMQSVRLPGKFVERLDILFLIFWVFAEAALISAYLYYAKRFAVSEITEKGDAVSEITEKGGAMPERVNAKDRCRGNFWYTMLWLAGICVGTLLIEKPETMFRFFIPYKMWIDGPLSILVPGFLYFRKDTVAQKGRRKKRRSEIAGMLGLMLLLALTGCKDQTDLEEKDYVMTLAIEEGENRKWKITYETAQLSGREQEGKNHGAKIRSYEGDSLKEAEEMNQRSNDKRLDYGHLKAIVFSRSWLETEEKRKSMEEELKEQTSLAGTTLLFFTEDSVENLLKAGEEQASSFGEFMENRMANQQTKIGQEDTLARFLKDESEQARERTILELWEEQGEIVLEQTTLSYPLSDLAETVLRFHIRANSDAEEDQQRKLAVRDRILPKLQELLKACTSKEECMDTIAQSIEQIQEWVECACEEENYNCTSDIYLCREAFPVRIYGDMVFPSGIYDALRIDLGKGEGANWWCMMYPSLCLSDGVVEGVSEEENQEWKENLEQKDYEDLFCKRENKFHFKWKVGEWLGRMFRRDGK